MEKIKTQSTGISGRLGSALARNHQVVKKAFVLLMMSVVWISVAAQYPYLRIANVMVTPDDQDSIVSTYIDGIVRYDSATRTLILQNATIYRYDSGDPYDDSNGNTVVIEAHSGQTVNIELIGHNTIFGVIPLELYGGSYNITGSGSLTLNGIIAGVLCELGVDTFRIRQGVSVEIDVPYLPSTGFQGSPQYQDYNQTVLSIDSSTLIIDADYCIRDLDGFQLNGSYVFSPEGACYDHVSRCLVTSEGPVRNYLEIRPGTVGIKEFCSSPFHVCGSDGGIYIKNAQENSSVEIVNMLGQVVHQSVLNGMDVYIPMRRGFYVVRVNNSSVKVVVK